MGREQLLRAVEEAGVQSCEDWWRAAGMDSIFTGDDRCLANLHALRGHVLANSRAWGKKAPEAKQQPSHHGLGAEELGAPTGSTYTSASQRRQQRAVLEARHLESLKLHEGYPKLAEGGKLNATTCLYCNETFPSRG